MDPKPTSHALITLILLALCRLVGGEDSTINMRAGLDLCMIWGWTDCQCLGAIRICVDLGIKTEADCELYHVRRECESCAETLAKCLEETVCYDDECTKKLNTKQDDCMKKEIPALRAQRAQQLAEGKLVGRGLEMTTQVQTDDERKLSHLLRQLMSRNKAVVKRYAL